MKYALFVTPDLPFTAIFPFFFFPLNICKPIGVDFAYRTVVLMSHELLTDKFTVWECSAKQ